MKICDCVCLDCGIEEEYFLDDGSRCAHCQSTRLDCLIKSNNCSIKQSYKYKDKFFLLEQKQYLTQAQNLKYAENMRYYSDNVNKEIGKCGEFRGYTK